MKEEIQISGVPSPDDNRFPAYLRELGIRIGMVADFLGSRENAASVAGISVDQLTHYIKGRAKPSFPALHRLCDAVGVRLDWIATGDGPVRLSEASSTPIGHGWDPELMRNCMIAADELLHELGREMEPAEKADAVLQMYRSELDRKVTGQPGLSPAEVVRLFRNVA